MSEKITRREFVRDGAVAAAGMAAGLSATYTVHAGNPEEADTSKIVNYNPDMEYRRAGKTDWMTSAVCLGGHWKRLNTVVPGLYGILVVLIFGLGHRIWARKSRSINGSSNKDATSSRVQSLLVDWIVVAAGWVIQWFHFD